MTSLSSLYLSLFLFVGGRDFAFISGAGEGGGGGASSKDSNKSNGLLFISWSMAGAVSWAGNIFAPAYLCFGFYVSYIGRWSYDLQTHISALASMFPIYSTVWSKLADTYICFGFYVSYIFYAQSTPSPAGDLVICKHTSMLWLLCFLYILQRDGWLSQSDGWLSR